MTKKKSRRDPVKDKIKDDRRMKRLTKALRKMEKKDRQPKPIIEMEVPNVLYSQAKQRTRDLDVPEQVREERHYLMKEWCQYTAERHRDEIYSLDRKLIAQHGAVSGGVSDRPGAADLSLGSTPMTTLSWRLHW